MARRKGMGKGKGMGYKNLIPKDPKVHSQSAKGIKQPQCLKQFSMGKINRLTSLKLSVMIAYGDSYNNTMIRNLKYLSPEMSVAEAKEVVKVIKSYNNFNGEKASEIISEFDDNYIQNVRIAREGSVGIYFKIPSWINRGDRRIKISQEQRFNIAKEINEAFQEKNMTPDEFHLVDYSNDILSSGDDLDTWKKEDWRASGVRLWWD